MGRYLKDELLIPDLALVSPALRTVETWRLVAAELGESVHSREEPRLYEAPYEDLLTVVRDVAPQVRTLLLVGHNPGSEELASELTGFGDRFAVQRMHAKFPTCGLAVLDFEAESWADVAEGKGRLDRFVTPGSLGDGQDD
jgi:phosphohistidine phosphatase